MAYIGNQPTEAFTTFATQTFSTSATSSYTLDHAVTNENEIALFVNNVRQQPGSGKAYTATGTALTLSANTASTDTMYCIRAEIPGMSKKDIDIELENNTLSVSGDRKWNDKNQNNYSEFSYGKFYKSFNLPEDVKENNIKASMRDGILSVQVPRLEKVKPEVKKIAIK